ncbi:MAG: NHL repeat-containing protein [candidate division KSB1 bacterium]|nr:NHL repeat-containing protein [candidate division KSB1 bacterium]MDZ7305421.1 NHL repeat-containing protein [candidate division KSB1 bacterium]MDZ7311734.1 NHL repeat-containing protein [candidate division KSB1 bacterium]
MRNLIVICCALGASFALSNQARHETLQTKNTGAIEIELTISQNDCPPDSRFARILDVETDSKGNIYILDDYHSGIWKFDTQGKYLLTFGKSGRKNGELGHPTDLIIDSQDNLYVLEGGNRRVSKFNRLGKFIASFKLNGAVPFWDLKGVLIPQDQLLISFYKDGKIFHVYDTNGTLLRSFGEPVRPEKSPFANHVIYLTSSLFYANGFLFHTHPFRYEIRKFELSSGKLAAVFSRFLLWWENPIVHEGGGLEGGTPILSTIVLPNGKILNFIGKRGPNKRLRYFFDIFEKDGTFLGTYETGYYTTCVDKNGKLYCIANRYDPWQAFRCTMAISAKSN